MTLSVGRFSAAPAATQSHVLVAGGLSTLQKGHLDKL